MPVDPLKGLPKEDLDKVSKDISTAMKPYKDKKKAEFQDEFFDITRKNPQELTREKIQASLERYKTSLLGVSGTAETAATTTLLADATALAGKITARLQAFEKAQKTPGVSKQTKIVKPQTSLLG